jgi:uncharacterized repeat protein (TIGR01451 family)
MMAFSPTQSRRILFAVIILAVTGTILFSSFPEASFAAGYNWLQFDFNAQHSGNNTLETTITKANVANLTLLFQMTLPPSANGYLRVADGAPAYLSGVSIGGVSTDLTFVTTRGADLIAVDARTGTVVWEQTHRYGAGACTDTNGGNCYTTTSPVIDPGLGFVYSYGLDSAGNSYVHKHAVDTGNETLTGGWPELATSKTTQEKGSADLSLATSGGVNYLYVANGGYPGDAGDYQGHLTTINLGTGAQTVYNTLCRNSTAHLPNPGCVQGPIDETQSAVWARAGTIYDPSLNRLFISTGNGDFIPGSFDWGDTTLALNPNGTGAGGGNPLDNYTPSNQAALQTSDADLGSTLPAILPNSAGAHWAVQSGKDAKLRIINLAKLNPTGIGAQGGEVVPDINVPQGGEVLTQPAVWVNPADNSTWVFVANDNGISGLQLHVTAGVPSLIPVWTNFNGGTSPILANNVLYYAGDGNLRALDPVSGTQLWTSTSTGTNIGGIHWESPIVANGVVYITDESAHLTAYWLGATATPTPTVTQGPSATPGANPGTTATYIPPSLNIADPQISKTSDQTLAIPGDTVKFTLFVSNPGSSPAPNVVITDPLPTSLNFVSAAGAPFSISGGMVTFTLGTVNPGQVFTLTIVTRVNQSVVPPLDITNTGTLTWSGGVSRSSTTLHIRGGQLPSTGEHPDDAAAPIGFWLGLCALGLVMMGVGYCVRQRV